jgi:hypothetical protein
MVNLKAVVSSGQSGVPGAARVCPTSGRLTSNVNSLCSLLRPQVGSTDFFEDSVASLGCRRNLSVVGVVLLGASNEARGLLAIGPCCS